jgi:AbiA family abortive infection protein
METFIKPSIKKELRFDAISQGQIIDFFKFLADGNKGIPQTDNDIVSSYLGHLYLIFGDLLVDQELNKNSKGVSSSKIIRYMDDFYISITFDEDFDNANREIYINNLAARISDLFYERLGLRLNTKTQLFWLNIQEHVRYLEESLKKVSPGHEVADEEHVDSPNDKIGRIFGQLENLKTSSLDPSFRQHRDLNQEILKEVYDKPVQQLMNRQDNKDRIREVFADFNFDLVLAQPREIMILLLHDSSAKRQFKMFLRTKSHLTSRDVYLILTYLCQTEFKSKRLIKFRHGSS